MVKLDVFFLKHLSKEDFRVLTAIEMGMKNHDLVPTRLINTISNLKFGGCFKSLSVLHKNKLIYHEKRQYDGYKLTYTGYDYLVLKTLCKRGSVYALGKQIGTGKESDIYIVVNEAEEQMAIKFQRLGRASFRTIKKNRDYHQHRKNASWLYLSRLAAVKEYSYMKALYDAGFPVPRPIDFNRHGVVMELIPGVTLNHLKELKNPGKVYRNLMNLLVKLANHGLIHGDFNEFNLLIDPKEEITVIDFPQMISVDHLNAEMYFNRDVECIRIFFEKRFGYVSDFVPQLNIDTQRTHSLDKEVEASGFTKEMQMEFEELAKEQEEEGNDEEGNDVDVDGEDVDIEDNGVSPNIGGDDHSDDADIDDENSISSKKSKPKSKKKDKSNKTEKSKPEEPKSDQPTSTTTTSTPTTSDTTNITNSEPITENTQSSTITAEESTPKDTPKEGDSTNKKGTDEEGDEDDEDSEEARDRERKERNEIQKKVRKQLAKQEKRKKGVRNAYKQRDKRALKEETKAWVDAL
eukprot:TRINITY_DN3753_c0_g1_i1.p1 TRINITY_DN3753_c0_g1~~TRINITY_DN3753_c0_g1_i1.p1  ORF type:complete len:519 (+),score=151.30 TRINITY_DN3753_c0_g1_i1:425-1981(+)